MENLLLLGISPNSAWFKINWKIYPGKPKGIGLYFPVDSEPNVIYVLLRVTLGRL